MSFCKKIILVSFVLSLLPLFMEAQDKLLSTVENGIKSDSVEIGRYTNRFSSEATFSLYVPNAVGSGFAKESMNGTLGFDLALKYFLFQNWFLNTGFTQEYYTIDNQERIGIYDRSTKLDLYASAGYFHQWNTKWNSTVELGAGYTQNKNRQDRREELSSLESATFRDSGTLLLFQSRLGYQLSKSVNVTLALNYQYAIMNIETSRRLESYFNDAQYLTARLGIAYAIESNKQKFTSRDQTYMEQLQGRNYDDLSIKEKRALYFLKRGRGVSKRDTSGNEKQSLPIEKLDLKKLQNKDDQQRLQELLSIDPDDMTIRQKRELYFLKQKLERQKCREGK